MPLSREAQDELLSEHGRLSTLRDQITAEMAEVAAVLRRYGRLPVQSDGTVGRTGAAARLVQEAPATVRVLSPHAGEATSLRDTLVAVLDATRRGYKPGEMTVELQRGGFPAGNAQTPLSARVSSELSRLYRERRIEKDAHTGRYKGLRVSLPGSPDGNLFLTGGDVVGREDGLPDRNEAGEAGTESAPVLATDAQTQ